MGKFADWTAELGTNEPDTASKGKFARWTEELNEGAKPRLDPRGRPYDPRFEPDEPERPLSEAARSFGDNVAAIKAARAQMASEPSLPTAIQATMGNAAAASAGPVVGAAFDTALSKIPGVRTVAQKLRETFAPEANPLPVDDPSITYDQRRAALSRLVDASRERLGLAAVPVEAAGGALGMLAMPAGAPITIGSRALGPTASIMAGAAGYGAAAGAGEAISHDLPPDEVAASALHGAGTGAVAGTLLHGAARGLNRITRAAPARVPSPEKAAKAYENAAQWVVHDIRGEVRGASTATARKQLADDAQHAAELVLRDDPLDKALNAARSGDLKKLNKADEAIRERLEDRGSKMAPLWAEADKRIGGGIRSGEFVESLKTSVAELRATGRTTDAAEADALEGILGRVTKAKDWGFDGKFNPEVPVRGGGLDGMKSGEAISVLEKQKSQLEKLAKKDGQTAATDAVAAIEADISRIKDAATSTSFDGNKIVPLAKLQRLWSDEAGLAYKGMGGIHGTQAFEKKINVAHHLRDFRDAKLAEVAAADANLVDDLSATLKDYATLKRMEQVIEQRINRAKSDAAGASVPADFVRAARDIKQSPVGWAVSKVPEAIVAARRASDRAIAKRFTPEAARAIRDSEIEMARRISRLIQAGVPRPTAIQAVRAQMSETMSELAGVEPAADY